MYLAICGGAIIYSTLFPDGGPRSKNVKWPFIIFDKDFHVYSIFSDLERKATITLHEDPSTSRTVTISLNTSLKEAIITNSDPRSLFYIFSGLLRSAYKQAGYSPYFRRLLNMKDEQIVLNFRVIYGLQPTLVSLLPNFETNDKKLHIIETFYKTPEKTLKILSREEIIQYAKEQKIYVDPNENKKPQKGEIIEHKPITPEELSKSLKGLIDKFSPDFRMAKKEFIDNIEVIKKQKEDAIVFWQKENEQPKDPKKKVDPKKNST